MQCKKLTAILTAFCMAAMCAPMAEMPSISVSIVADASETGVYENLHYQKFVNHIEIIGSEEETDFTSLVIPAEIDSLPVTVIGAGSFSSHSEIEEVSLPDTIQSIQSNAFSSATKLTAIRLPSGLKTLALDAFSYRCAFESITVGDGNTNFKAENGILTDINETILYRCAVTRTEPYLMPDTIQTMANGAFYLCDQLTGVTISTGLTQIPSNAFYRCTALTELTIPQSVAYFSYDSFVHLAPDVVITMENPYISLSSSSLSSFKTESYINDEGKEVSVSYFTGTFRGYDNSTLKAAVDSYNENISDETKKIKFESLGVSDLPDPRETTTTAYQTTAPSTETYYTATKATTTKASAISSNQITADGLLSYSLYEDHAIITGLVKNTADLVIPAEIEGKPVTGISTTFSNTDLVSVSLPASVTNIPGECFGNCQKLTSISMPGVTNIGYYAFRGCISLESIDLPDSLTNIERNAFEGSGLTSVSIPGSLTHVGGFYGCGSLQSVTIGEGAQIIDYDAFTCCRHLTSLSLPSTLTSIEGNAFASCDSLGSIILPENLQSIGDYAFACCGSLTEIDLPDSITRLEENTFQQCTSLSSVKLPANLTSFNLTAFNKTAISELTIPASVTYISAPYKNSSYTGIEYSYPNLENIYVDENNTRYKSVDGVVTDNYGSLVLFPPGRTGVYSVPENIRSISSGAFIGSQLENITLHKDFYWSSSNYNPLSEALNLQTIEVSVLNSSLIDIDGVLYQKNRNNDQLELLVWPAGKGGTAVIPDNVSNVRAGTFQNCKALTEIIFPENLTSLLPENTYSYSNNNIFGGCTALQSVTLPSQLEEIPSYAFVNCSALTNITLPESLTKIGSYAFYRTGLTSVQLPAGVTSLGEYAFAGCPNLTDAVLSNTGRIPSCLFLNCTALQSVTIPEGVLEIYHDAFGGCTSLTNVSMPESLMNIYRYAFSNCTALEEIYIPSGVSGIEQIVEHTTATDASGSEISYTEARATTRASVSYSNDATPDIPSHAQAFPGCVSLKKFVVSKDNQYYADIDGVLVSKDGTELRQYPAGLTGEYEIPASITSIANYAFQNCQLSGVNIPSNVQQIGADVFSNCHSLENVTLPDNLQMISRDMFYNCESLKNVILPDGLTSINPYAFSRSGISQVTLPSSVTQVLGLAFGGCPNLNEITFMNPDCTIEYSAVSGYSEPASYAFEPDVPDIETGINYYINYGNKKSSASVAYSYNADITVVGYDDSSAKEFADSHSYKFKSLGAREGTAPATTTETVPVTTETTPSTTENVPDPTEAMTSPEPETTAESETAPQTETTVPTETTASDPPNPDQKNGDVNNDDDVNAADAAILLKEITLMNTQLPTTFSPEVLKIADVDESGNLTAADSAYILIYSTASKSGAISTTMDIHDFVKSKKG